MGNTLTVPCQDISQQALARARGLQLQVGGPSCRGAIVDYCNSLIDEQTLLQHCTPLEAIEFGRLAPAIYVRWLYQHRKAWRCKPKPGKCQFPEDRLHLAGCDYHNPLPPELLLPEEWWGLAFEEAGVPKPGGPGCQFPGWGHQPNASGAGHSSGQHGHQKRRAHSEHRTRHGHASGADHSGGHKGHKERRGQSQQRVRQEHQGRSGSQSQSRQRAGLCDCVDCCQIRHDRRRTERTEDPRVVKKVVRPLYRPGVTKDCRRDNMILERGRVSVIRVGV